MSESLGNRDRTSNRVPSQHEIASLRALALEKQERLANVAASTRLLQIAASEVRHRYQEQSKILEELQSELKMSDEATGSLEKATLLLEKDLAAISGLLHPIRRTPDDVLRLIFEDVVQSEVQVAEDKRQWVAVWLSHVCRRWRSIAVSTPRIWSHMSFAIKPSGFFNSGALSTFLARAKSVPISVKLKFSVSNYVSAASLQRVYELFDPNILQPSRISMLEIKIDPASSYSFLDRFPQFPVEEIDTLTLSVPAYGQESMGMACLVSRFKRVRKLLIKDSTFGSLSVPLKHSTAPNLEELVAIRVKRLPLLELLTQLPNLRYFMAKSCTITEPTTDAFNDSVLPSLEILNIHGTSFPWANVQCPRLTKFIISMANVLETETEEMSEFLERSKTIRDLTFEKGNHIQLSQLVRRAPQITRLEIEDDRGGTIIRDTFVDELILPHLHELTFSGVSRRLPIAGLNEAIRIRRMRKNYLQGANTGPVFNLLEEILVEISPQDVSLLDKENKEYLEKFLDYGAYCEDPLLWIYYCIEDEDVK
ncbi:hypothetical protein M408DRAFT_29197 [Serendipita vermifera MAFF 305830]|uniref:Uncharacterized protein n=1 Tax=Serendipita vermifera MAFF 305830 TaxID=933852 RepID=A0A0C2W5Z8_SERVB|nr:hypothetical protein M408DRAFT_29197 [Serendipita vermifera MAFF 305830]